HVVDLASAHLSALDYLNSTSNFHSAFNIGTGAGYSVREVVEMINSVTGVSYDPELLPRRLGDPARIVGEVGLAFQELGWSSQLSLREMIESAWSAHTK
ncbi:MAG: UDP-glucose 4-epimerase GalE, partial [Aurantimicrobium sp.]